MRRFALPLLIASSLAGCGSPSPAPTPSPTSTAATGDTARIASLSPALRAGVLLRAIRDAGQDCQQVIAQAKAPVAGKPPAWVATCQDKHRWVVTIEPDGTANVIDADDVARLH
jgi:hypothetical protein